MAKAARPSEALRRAMAEMAKAARPSEEVRRAMAEMMQPYEEMRRSIADVARFHNPTEDNEQQESGDDDLGDEPSQPNPKEDEDEKA